MYSLEEIRDELQKIIDMTRNWLVTFGPGTKSPRPQTEIEIKQKRLDVLKYHRDQLDMAIERKRGTA